MPTYEHLLVPLDGSKPAEASLTHAMEMAKRYGAEVTLLTAVSPFDEVMVSEGEPMFLNELWKVREKAAQEYLEAVVQRPEWAGVEVHRVLEIGSPAESIIDYAAKHRVDLIVMATHGRSGLKRWVFGSVAEKVLRGAKHPILLVPVLE